MSVPHTGWWAWWRWCPAAGTPSWAWRSRPPARCAPAWPHSAGSWAACDPLSAARCRWEADGMSGSAWNKKKKRRRRCTVFDYPCISQGVYSRVCDPVGSRLDPPHQSFSSRSRPHSAAVVLCCSFSSAILICSSFRAFSRSSSLARCCNRPLYLKIPPNTHTWTQRFHILYRQFMWLLFLSPTCPAAYAAPAPVSGGRFSSSHVFPSGSRTPWLAAHAELPAARDLAIVARECHAAPRVPAWRRPARFLSPTAAAAAEHSGPWGRHSVSSEWISPPGEEKAASWLGVNVASVLYECVVCMLTDAEA